MNSSSTPDKVEVKLNSKLNINAPAFEPKKGINANALADDGIYKKVNIKSTMLVPPQRQQMNYLPAFLYSNQIQFPVKMDYNDGAIALANLSIPSSESPQVVSNSIVALPQQKHINSTKKENSATFNQNGNTSFRNSSDVEHFVPNMVNTISVPPISAANIPLIISQNNQRSVVWHPSNAQSPQVALMPSYYSPINSFYFIRPSILAPLSSVALPQNKSNMKINIRNKVFDTGDTEQDNILSNIAKSINPLDEFVFRSKNCRFFVIKSFTEDNIYQAIRHSVWCSTPSGNDILVTAYTQAKSKELEDDDTTTAHVYLFFSVNGSGYFCGVAEMTSDLNSSSNIWNQKKWQAQFNIQWLYIKDIPNSYLRHIKLENNDNRPVTNCRDATEILPLEKGIEVLRIIHNLDYDTCLLNDFNTDSNKNDKG